MSDYKYVFSFYAKQNTKRVTYPKWWQFWKKPIVAWSMDMHRFSMPLTEREGLMVINESHDNYTGALLVPLIVRALSNQTEIHGLQIEEIIHPRKNHIASEYVITEDSGLMERT